MSLKWKGLKPIAIAVLVAFTTLALRVDLLAAPKAKPQPAVQKKVTSAAQFQDLLKETEKLFEGMEADLGKKKDVSPRLAQLKQHRSDLQGLASTIRGELAKTRAELISKKLPAEIIQRHDAFAQHFEENLKALLVDLDGAEQAKQGQLQARVKAARDYLKKNIYRKKQISPLKPTYRLKHLKQAPRQEKQARFNQPSEGIAFTGRPSHQSSFRHLSRFFNFFISEAEAAGPQYSEYLGQSIEVQLTQEIRDLANSLDNNPLKIYQFVRNNFIYEPYYGSLKGAIGTLHDRAGNDFDQASLLIALLRASNIPARYVYGQVEIPIERAKSWVGVDNLLRVADLLFTCGIPAVTLISGGKPSAIRIEHCWVEAFVDYIPSRGAIHKQGDTWIPLDPSFKLQDIHEGEDISGQVHFDVAGYLSKVQTGDALAYYISQVREYISANMPDKELFHIIRTRNNIRKDLEALPASLPYQKISTIDTYAEIPNNKRHQLRVTVTGGGSYAEGTTYQTSLPELTDSTLTLSYLPASASDDATVQSYGDLYSTPAYLVRLKPVLKVDGMQKVVGDAIGFGQEQQLIIEIIMPNQETARIQNDIIAGEYYAICVTWPSITMGANKTTEKLKNHFLTIGTNIIQGGYVAEDLCGTFLSLQGRTYFAQVGSAQQIAASLLHLPLTQDVDEATVSFSATVEYLFGIPNKVQFAGVMIDADRNVSVVVPKPGEEWKAKEYMTLIGHSSSAFEHLIWEQKFGPGAISAVKAIQIARESNIPIHDIDSTNLDIVPTLGVAQSVKEDIYNSINAGYVVKIPQSNITYEDWTGVGYIVTKPSTGDGWYKIAFANGGYMLWMIFGLQFQAYYFLRHYEIQEKAIAEAERLGAATAAGEITECQAFAQFAQFLADQYSEVEFRLSFFLRSLYDLSITDNRPLPNWPYYIWPSAGLLGPLGPRSKRPQWLNNHDDGDWGSGYRIFYYWDLPNGKTDLTGRRDHFVTNANRPDLGVLYELFIGDPSENDIEYNSLGREFHQGIDSLSISKTEVGEWIKTQLYQDQSGPRPPLEQKP